MFRVGGQPAIGSQVYLADLEGSPPRQLTTGEASSYAPQWSPDGQSIAFLSQNNIWLMSLPSGDTRQVTQVPTGVSSFKWSPDGNMIAFTAEDETTPEEIQTIQQNNGVRIVDQGVKNQRLYLVSLADIAQGPICGRPLTGSDINIGAPEVPEIYNWTPDCKTIFFNHSKSPRPNDMPTTRMAAINLEDGAIRPIGPQDVVVLDPACGHWRTWRLTI